jgi:hypothetical protein
MSIFDILIDTEEIVVLGPPNQIDVSVDIGAQGERGSKFFTGSGNPNVSGVISPGEEIIIGDVFINSSTASEYSWLYIYTNVPGATAWTPVVKLQPSIYARHIETTFDENGEANVSVPLSDIVSDITILDVDRYVIELTTVYANPVSLTVKTKTISGSNLNFVIKAIEYDSSWQVLEGVIKLGVIITVV